MTFIGTLLAVLVLSLIPTWTFIHSSPDCGPYVGFESPFKAIESKVNALYGFASVPIGVLFDEPAHCRSVFISVILFVSVTVAPFKVIESKVNALCCFAPVSIGVLLCVPAHYRSVFISVTLFVSATVAPCVRIESKVMCCHTALHHWLPVLVVLLSQRACAFRANVFSLFGIV